MGNILIIEDDQDTRYVLKVVLESKKHTVKEASSGKEALSEVENTVFDAIVLDRILGDMDGLLILDKIKKDDQGLPVIMLTGHADVQSAVKAMKLGALDYLIKPFSNEELLLIVERAIKERRFFREFEALRNHILNYNSKKIVFGESPQIKAVANNVGQVAKTELTVILLGPSGSGKEVWARQMHNLSLRNKNPFVALDCGALPENLVESEIFGYEKGAFTGADRQKKGLMETAFGGTLFLDEISNLTLSTQAKLLRVLQERKIRRLGGKKDIPIDIRIIVATNSSLQDGIKGGVFREDLFHRLNQFSINLPSLLDRRTDIPVLAMFFLKEANKTLKKNVENISSQALKILSEYDWPGNIRELKNTVTRAALLADKTIFPSHLGFKNLADDIMGKPQPKDFPPSPKGFGRAVPLTETGRQSKEGEENSGNNFLDEEDYDIKKVVKSAGAEIEKRMISKALIKAKGNKVLSAKILGIDRKALYYKIKEYGINSAAERK
ncbi:MAG: sigma-54 dependent transcriptional regulator [Elusimicrobia bacterium]|nr:sigma-54 dependent transcriptional regulator [Elusimicrobiota bacterium]